MTQTEREHLQDMLSLAEKARDVALAQREHSDAHFVLRAAIKTQIHALKQLLHEEAS